MGGGSAAETQLTWDTNRQGVGRKLAKLVVVAIARQGRESGGGEAARGQVSHQQKLPELRWIGL